MSESLESHLGSRPCVTVCLRLLCLFTQRQDSSVRRYLPTKHTSSPSFSKAALTSPAEGKMRSAWMPAAVRCSDVCDNDGSYVGQAAGAILP